MLNLFSFMEETNNSTWSTVILIVMVVLVVALLAGSFFMQRKQKKQAEESVKSLKEGDEIVTIGGIKGKIVAIDDVKDTMDIETGNGAVITFFKGAIQQIPAPKQPAAAPSENVQVTAETTENAAETQEEDIVEEQVAAEETTTDEEIKH